MAVRGLPGGGSSGYRPRMTPEERYNAQSSNRSSSRKSTSQNVSNSTKSKNTTNTRTQSSRPTQERAIERNLPRQQESPTTNRSNYSSSSARQRRKEEAMERRLAREQESVYVSKPTPTAPPKQTVVTPPPPKPPVRTDGWDTKPSIPSVTYEKPKPITKEERKEQIAENHRAQAQEDVYVNTPPATVTPSKPTVTTTTTSNATTPNDEPAHHKTQSDYDIMQEELKEYKKSPTVVVYTADKNAVTSGLGDGRDVKAGIPINYAKTSNMSKTKIGTGGTPDYFIISHKNAYSDKNGLMRYRLNPDQVDEKNDYYCLALPRGFKKENKSYDNIYVAPNQWLRRENVDAGQRFEIILKDKANKEYKFNAMLTVSKNSSSETDIYPHDHILEFITETNQINSNISLDYDKGNIDLDKLIGGNDLELYQMKEYKNSALFRGNYYYGEWNEKTY